MKKTILVVDDLAIFREPIEAILRIEGYDVVTAANGVEALAAISKAKPDLVLLDLSMPVLDGMGVLKAMRENAATKSVPVLVLSAKTERDKVREAISLGITGYLLKVNFSLATMLQRVRRVLEPSAGQPPVAPVQNATEDPRLEQEPQQTVSGENTIRAVPAGSTAAPGETLKPQVQTVAKKRVPSGGNAVPQSARMATESETSWKARQAAIAAQIGGGGGRLVVKPGDDLKSLRPLLTRSEVMQRVNTDEELQGFSPTVAQVLKLTASSHCSMEDVSKAVSQDHAVALKILKLANSSIFNRGDRVDTVQKAVLRIGIQSIRQAVLNIGVVERFGGESLHEELSTPLFWEHSIATGIIAAELAHALGHKDADIAFTAGLLHDLGRILYAERLEKEYGDVLRAARTLRVPLEQAETRLLLMSHAEVMDKVLHTWRFPKELVNPIVFHHAEIEQVRTLVPRQISEVLRLALADRLAHALMLGSSGNDVIYPTHEQCATLGVGAETIANIASSVPSQTDETKFALLSRSTTGETWPRLVERVRDEIGQPVSCLFVGEHGATDAFRIFCETLNHYAGGSASQPSVAVVHITTAKERESLSHKLIEAEDALALSNTPGEAAQRLPVLVLSPDGRLTLDEAVARGRACRLIATPTPMANLVDAMRRLLMASAPDMKKAA